ncbi:hypothetical protein Athai_31860 [Actinocatenispora thailandica]|uniref:Glycosyl transferase n=1 Tax=Actinocatenispora thailandica TaxID=227318 RepID=A0A7R7DQ06_9ACTN|nr:glycosyltransferase family 39 protein [Actinocatenispora thailandica]BCJ35683.1 hypothetical protein Athai_31860 [Actinocatenispora thailandica]
MSATTLTTPIRAAFARTTNRPAWVRPALAVLLLGTAALYLVNLSANGYANSFYAGAVQAGTISWKALLFGAVDAGSGITVDKPPASIWLMALSGRVFGFSSWSMLVPQALLGVASVALLYGAVRRVAGYAAGIAAGAILALTPVAVLMFRFNNPDALLVLLMVAGAYAVTRAIERGSMWWLVLAGSALGFGFLTKMLQAFLVLPAFAVVYLVAAPISLRRRIGHLLAAGAALVVSAGWYVALVELWPAGSRPYIGGSTDNSLLQLAIGYNGLSRITGGSGGGPGAGGMPGGGPSSAGSGLPGGAREVFTGAGLPGGGGPGGGGNSMFGGATGPLRMFSDTFGTQISWLLPAALLALVAGVWLTRRAARTDRTRAALVLWGGWLLVTMAVFSFMSGIIHPYYSVALAPAIAAVLAIGVHAGWERRERTGARVVLAALVAVTGIWSYQLLGRAPSWQPWLRYAVLVAAAAGVCWLVIPGRWVRRVALVAVPVLALASIGAPAAYAAQTAATAHTGSIPTAGPSGRGTGGFPGGGRGLGVRNRYGFAGAGPGTGGVPGNGSTRGGNGTGVSGGTGNGAPGGMPGQGSRGAGGNGQPPGGATGTGPSQGAGTQGDSGQGSAGQGDSGQGSGAGQPDTGGQAGTRGPGGAASVAGAVATLLKNAHGYRWAAATNGTQQAAELELASGGAPVLGIGGFSGSDAYPTLAQFEKYVAAGDIRYYLPGGMGGGRGGPGGAGASSSIESWVAAHFTKKTVGGSTVYDLSKPTT